MTFPEYRVFVLVNIYIFFVNNKHCKNASDLCVGGILDPGPQTQLKLKLKHLTSPNKSSSTETKLLTSVSSQFVHSAHPSLLNELTKYTFHLDTVIKSSICSSVSALRNRLVHKFRWETYQHTSLVAPQFYCIYGLGFNSLKKNIQQGYFFLYLF